jgi:hypothetical protein
VYEFYTVTFFYGDGFEILSVDETAVNLDYYRWIVLFAPVQQVLDRQITTGIIFGKTVEYESQFSNLNQSS